MYFQRRAFTINIMRCSLYTHHSFALCTIHLFIFFSNIYMHLYTIIYTSGQCRRPIGPLAMHTLRVSLTLYHILALCPFRPLLHRSLQALSWKSLAMEGSIHRCYAGFNMSFSGGTTNSHTLTASLFLTCFTTILMHSLSRVNIHTILI